LVIEPCTNRGQPAITLIIDPSNRTVLALDMYEHSYHIDYGANAAAYVDAFMAAINWPAVGRAFCARKPETSASDEVGGR
jgi:superoxide dismutase